MIRALAIVLFTAIGLVVPAAQGAAKDTPGIDAQLISGDFVFLGSQRCVIGFNARDGAARPFIIVGGGCTATGQAGPVAPPAGSTQTPYVRGPGGVRLVLVGPQTAAVGMRVCASAPIAGFRCGTVLSLNATVCYPQGCVSGLIRTNVCLEPGESGAPLVTTPTSTTARAVGINFGGSGNCSTGGTSYFQPIGQILSRYGLTLVTGRPPA